jgi:hypothetical protein
LIYTFLDRKPSPVASEAYALALDEACQEGRTAIEEGEAILREVATNDSVMGDETAHKKRRAADNISFAKDCHDPADM